MQMKGKVYLIPCLLGGEETSILPEFNKKIVAEIDVFVVENLRSARRFLRTFGYTKNFDTEVQFFELDKHAANLNYTQMLQPALKGKSIGLISEAGNPCIADPGNELVAKAHQLGIEVVPLVGPSSILLALIGSGFNGQQFAFNGYLPVDNTERIKKLKQLEAEVLRSNTTQLFMETPYRNQKLLEEIIAQLAPETKLCIACDLTLPEQFIRTHPLSFWKQNLPELHKRYVMFALGK